MVDNEVLSEVFTKLGIETKIDQIEAEFNAEAKAARAAIRLPPDPAKRPPTPEKPQPQQSHFEAYGDPSARVHHHRFLTFIVCLLGIVFVAQAVYLFRHHIAQSFPDTRPVLVSLCETVGCTMPLPRDISKIRLGEQGYTLNKRPEEHLYVLFVQVRNDANFEQDWPSIELTLFNFIKQPLSRRIFTPAEWVKPEMLAKGGGIAPKSNVDTHLELRVTGITPHEPELKLLYP